MSARVDGRFTLPSAVSGHGGPVRYAGDCGCGERGYSCCFEAGCGWESGGENKGYALFVRFRKGEEDAGAAVSGFEGVDCAFGGAVVCYGGRREERWSVCCGTLVVVLPYLYTYLQLDRILYEEIRTCFTSISLKRAKVPHPCAILCIQLVDFSTPTSNMCEPSICFNRSSYVLDWASLVTVE